MKGAAEFIAAVASGDLAAVRTALAADPDLARCRNESGVSVVCLAVYFGREEIARLLGEARADLDVFEASTLGNGDRVRKLITSAPELLDSYSPDGFHALGYAWSSKAASRRFTKQRFGAMPSSSASCCITEPIRERGMRRGRPRASIAPKRGTSRSQRS